eukprot:m.210436 g.210436  ORF g.210436 m.210436 type:complete len:337 (+) comp10735_c1_seq2:5255-6265(+)
MRLVHLEQERVVCGLGKAAFLIHKVKNTLGLLGNEIKNILIVDKLDAVPLKALTHVDLLLLLEDVLVEVLLKSLVGIVDEKLLKTVDLESLKPENVEHANCTKELALILARDGAVDLRDDPGKLTTVDTLGKSIATVFGLRHGQGGRDGLSANAAHIERQGIKQGLLRNSTEGGNELDSVHLLDGEGAVLAVDKSQVAQVKNNGNCHEQARHIARGETKQAERLGNLLKILLVKADLLLDVVEVAKMRGVLELQKLELVLGEASEQHVENVVVSITCRPFGHIHALRGLVDDAGLFEKVLANACADDLATGVKLDFDEFAEATRIVVALRLSWLQQ